ncbi:hypothetical protein QWA_18382 [Alcaligenes faecalis subsp. faecalis NCIB 8687]|nr:hypothetical protein QWA_18382 [Alcaligenes faecalis subsp. faecalis NCIB 8687]
MGHIPGVIVGALLLSVFPELLDTLLLWKGNVELDTQGRATVMVPLKDSLTQSHPVGVAVRLLGSMGHRHARMTDTGQRCRRRL